MIDVRRTLGDGRKATLRIRTFPIKDGEGAIQGFVDEIMDMGQAEYTETMAADMPGWETEALGEKARQHGCYIMATLKTKNPKFPERFFNTVFIVDPTGEVCYQHQKNIVLHVEHEDRAIVLQNIIGINRKEREVKQILESYAVRIRTD